MLNPRKRRSQLIYSVDVVPAFLAIFLVTYLVFLVGGPGAWICRGVSVELAKTNSPLPQRDVDREDAVIVMVMRDGALFLNNQKIPLEELSKLLRAELDRTHVHTIFIKADRRSKYGATVDVLDAIHATGAQHIAFLVEKQKPKFDQPE